MLAALALLLQCSTCTSDSAVTSVPINPVVVSMESLRELRELQRLAALPPVIVRQTDTVAVLDTAELRRRIEVALAPYQEEEEAAGFWAVVKTWAPLGFSVIAVAVALSSRKAGPQGIQGVQGIEGPEGPKGPEGPEGPSAKHPEHPWCWPPGHCKPPR